MRFLLLLCALLSAGLLSGPADARSRDREARNQQQEQRREDRDAGREQWREQRRDRSAEAGRRAQQRNGGGRVLSVERDNAGYRVKVLKDGEVRVHHVEDN
jgi:hypothetical protein